MCSSPSQSPKLICIREPVELEGQGVVDIYTAGESYHLFTKTQFDELKDQPPPEITRVNLGPLIIQMKSLGIANIIAFDYFTRPSESNLVRALETLKALQVIDLHSNLTDMGKKVNDFPMDPKLAVALLTAGNFFLRRQTHVWLCSRNVESCCSNLKRAHLSNYKRHETSITPKEEDRSKRRRSSDLAECIQVLHKVDFQK